MKTFAIIVCGIFGMLSLISTVTYIFWPSDKPYPGNPKENLVALAFHTVVILGLLE